MVGTCINSVVVRRLWLASELPGAAAKMQIAGPNHRATDSVSLGERLRNCVSDKFLGDDAVILSAMLREQPY